MYRVGIDRMLISILPTTPDLIPYLNNKPDRSTRFIIRFNPSCYLQLQRLKPLLVLQSPVVAASGKSPPARTDYLVRAGGLCITSHDLRKGALLGVSPSRAPFQDTIVGIFIGSNLG